MLKKLKQMLGLLEEDESMDDKLSWILDSTQSRLKVLLGGVEPGSDLEYIVIEVSIARYNRIGSEGLSTHTVEGESQNFQESYFAAYMDDIRAYKEAHNQDEAKGGILWI